MMAKTVTSLSHLFLISPTAAYQASRPKVDASKPRENPELAQTGENSQELSGKYDSNQNQDPPNVEAQKSKENIVDKISFSNTTSKSKSRALRLEIVVAHYNEPLDWLKPYAKRAGHVYHKGFDRGPPFDIYKWEELPNVGREAHTYLYHIIENYDNLADVTVFLQGHRSDPKKAVCFASPKVFFINAMRKIFCKKNFTYSDWDHVEHIGKKFAQLNNGQMRGATMTVGEFYTALFGTEPPASVPRCPSACFSATRENLLRRRLSFYQKAITFVNFHSNPEEVHYFEILWAVIINGP